MPSSEVSKEGRGWTPAQWKACLLMYPSYMAVLFSRTAIDVSVPAMLADTTMAIDQAQTATLLSTGVCFYIVGKIVGGTFTDKLGGSRTFAATVLNATVCMIAIASSRSITTMSLLWGLSRLGGGSYYPAMNSVTRSHWPVEQFGTAWSIMCTSSRVGAIFGGLVGAVVLRLSSWRTLLRISSGYLGVSGILMALFLRDGAHGESVESPVVIQDGGKVQLQRTESFGDAMTRMASSARIALCFTTTMMMMPLNGLNSLVPLYLVQNSGLSLSKAASYGTAYPVGAVVSMLVTARLFEREWKSPAPPPSVRVESPRAPLSSAFAPAAASLLRGGARGGHVVSQG
jgi:sugar phosphate permease|eukprot:SAG25_NODE_68_length_17436_cov_79.923055_19_plen_343_part_00